MIAGAVMEVAKIRPGREVTVSLWAVLFFVFLLVGSISAVVYGVRVLLGKAGKMRILEQGRLSEKGDAG
jgi:hypothetical protein